MKTVIATIVIILGSAGGLFPQAKFRKLPMTINHPSLNVSAPYISAEANALVFISDNAEDYELTPFFTFRERSEWKEPQVFPKTIYTRLNFLRGFALSADGRKLFYTTSKGPGVGGFDIWTSDWNGAGWSAPANTGMPINSKEHDGCPSVTPDGKTIYFMRCEKMDRDKAGNCRLLRATKQPNGTWEEPEELPAFVNTGNSQTPRIMADAETLIFSSDKMDGGKGGMDLFVTTWSGAGWSPPRPLDFVNTPGDDQYVTASALGRYLVRDEKGARKNELVEHLFPEEVRPKGMMKIEGKITAPSGEPVPSYISIADLNTDTRYYHGRPLADGTFTAYLREGARYELSIDPEYDHLTFYSRQFDLTTEKIPQVEKISALLKPLADGDEIDLDMFAFRPYTSDLEVRGSAASIKRLMRLFNGNPGMAFEIQVLLEGYMQDSIQSDPDLTEALYDSAYFVYDDIDSLGQLYQRDTIIVETIWHNDRTTRQAEALVEYLVSQGAKENAFSVFANATPALLPENKKLIIRAVARLK